MAKKREGWERGQGPYSGSDDLNLRRKSMVGSGNAPGDVKDRSRVVDSNNDANGGFSAPLRPTQE